MKIALIGGSGFIGSRLIELLLQRPDTEVVNIDLRESPFFESLSLRGDVRDRTMLTSALEGADAVVLLAAEHRDDVTPVSRYYETNVEGVRNTLAAMEANSISRLVFISSVAVYGPDSGCCDESGAIAPASHYGKSKAMAENVLSDWFATHPEWNIDILRPTVTFGERNRGNVYNLLSQIAGRRFLMVGKGDNVKSMAYVGNVAAFLLHLLDNVTTGLNVFNYVDGPDMTTNSLVSHVGTVLRRRVPSIHFPLWLGMAGGRCFDLLAWMLRRKLPISSVRVKKFCSSTQFNATKAHSGGFKAPYSLAEGLRRTLEFEFLHRHSPDKELKL